MTYWTELYHRQREELVDRLGGKCKRCGATERLEFDHIDPATKVIDMGRLRSHSKAAIEAEFPKIQLLCRPCHLDKTSEDLGHALRGHQRHGDLTSYRFCGPPKCEPCKKAKRDWQREWRKSHPRKTSPRG